jgi:hypothetical protein
MTTGAGAAGATASTGHARRRAGIAFAERAVSHPSVAYLAIAALQLRILWKVWDYKDLVFGDTSSYFTYASAWVHGLHDNIVWSPLYTDYFGTISALIHNVYAAETVERMSIIFGAALLVLALMRKLLGPAIGLALAIWWVVLAPNYNVTFEVHLFAVLPILVATLILVHRHDRRTLGAALALLLGATLLIRNELIIATTLMAIAVLRHEWRTRRVERVTRWDYLRAYALPLAVVVALTGGAYWRSYVHGRGVAAQLAEKQDLNLCQFYAFNYQQRYPKRFTGAPFTQCGPLMQRTFGRQMPSYLTAVEANPGAMAAMVAWNAQLIPSGIQVSLFGATGTSGNPDFYPVSMHRVYALVLLLLAGAIVIAGVLAARRDRRFWRHEWLRERRWALILLATIAVNTLFVALTERPRPEYLYGLTVGLMVVIGTAATALLRRFGLNRFVAPGAALLLLVLLVTIPPFYRPGPRPIHDAVDRLQGVRGVLEQPSSALLTLAPGYPICNYLTVGFNGHCSVADVATVEQELAAGQPLASVLARNKVTVIYADPLLEADAEFRSVVADPGAVGFRVVAAGSGTDGPWSVLLRRP